MPCYYDTPDSSNQKEIEKRAMIRMYFEASSLAASKREDIKMFPHPDKPHERLCEVCKLLTAEEMKGISAHYYQIEWLHKTLLDWYAAHLLVDWGKNEGEEKYELSKESNRIGYKIYEVK